MHQKKIQTIIVTVSMVFLLLAFFNPSVRAESNKAQYGGVLRIITLFEANALGFPPSMTGAGSSIKYAGPSVETLIRFNQDGKPSPHLATEWSVNPKDKTIILVLRKGVKFHDGTEFNAEAVKWNLDQFIASGQRHIKLVKSVDVIKPFKVKLTLSNWDNSVLGQLGVHAGLMISPTAFQKNGKEWCEKNPVGTGPFKLVKWERDVIIKYAKFDDYWQKGKPYLDGIEWVRFADSTSAEMAFRAGEVDIYNQVSPSIAAGLAKQGYVITHSPGMLRGIVGDSAHSDSPFADIRVRQAISHAIDFQAICDAIGYGFFTPVNQPAPPDHWAYNSTVVGYPYNPKKAKQLLAEAGYPNGLKIDIIWPGDLPELKDTIAMAQAYLAKVGIEAKVTHKNIGGILEHMRGGWNNALFYWSLRTAVPDLPAELLKRTSGLGSLWPSIEHPSEIDEMFKKALATPDFKEKQQISHQIMKLLTDKYALVSYSYAGSSMAAKQKYVQDDHLVTDAVDLLWTPENAWLKKK